MKTALFLVAALFVCRADAALVKTFTVNSTGDEIDSTPGDGVCETHLGNHTCTLRAAVMEANHTSSGTTQIVFPSGPQGTYTLGIPIGGANDETTGDLNITRSTSILGAGSATTVLDAAGVDHLFFIESPAVVTVSDLTIKNGDSSVTGGAIRNTGSLTVANCTIISNEAPSGGGITSSGPSLTVKGSRVQSNQTTSGAVGGGGVLVASGTANFVNTTFLNNESQGNGGAIACTGDAVCSLFNVTVENNKADSDSNASGFGGGVSTTSSGVFTLSNSILHHNTVGAVSPTFDDCNGSFVSSGTNILTGLVAGHCQVTGTTSAEDPKTGLLNQNGGETATLALTTGSPAIDAGLDGCPDQNGTPLTVDQRGAHRPTGAACDLGAYEFEANGDVNGDGTRDVADVFALINFLFAGSATPPGLGDADGNVVTDVADVFYLINFLFAGGPAPL